MAEQSTVFVVTQVGVETTPGTAVPANKLLQAVSIEPAGKSDIKSFRPRGFKYNAASVLGKEWTESKISGPMAYNDLTYLMASSMAYAAPTQINAGAGLAYKWLFQPVDSAPDTIKTFTLESGSSVRAQKLAYGIVDSLGWKLNRDSFDVDGTLLGQQLQDGITLTATPTQIALVPIVPSTVDVFMDSSGASLGNTKLLRVFEVDFKLSDRFGPVWPINSQNASFAVHTEKEPKVELKITLEADATGMGLLTTMRNGTKEFFRIKATGAQIDASPTPASYTFQFDLCGEVTAIGEFKDEEGIYAIEFTFEATWDSTWGYAYQAELINTLSAL